MTASMPVPPGSHRSAIVAALLVGATGSCHAQGQPPLPSVQIYGTIDVGVGQIETQPPGAPNARINTVRGVHSGNLQTSYIGFRGTEDLGGGWVARFQMESFLRVDTGQNGRFDASPTGGADHFWSRETFVGLGSKEAGELRLGTNAHPTWIAMLQTNALGANSVFSPSFRQLFNGGARGRSEVDTAMVNSVRYLTPNFFGVEGSLAVQAGEGSGSRYNLSGNLGYRSGPLFVTAAFTEVRHAPSPNLAGVRDQRMVLVGGAYDFGPVKLFAQYTAIDNDRLRTKEKVPHVGFSAPIGNGVLQFSTGQDKTSGASTAKRTTTSLGYVHSLSKRTDVYAFAIRDDLTVGNADSYVVGIRHRF